MGQWLARRRVAFSELIHRKNYRRNWAFETPTLCFNNVQLRNAVGWVRGKVQKSGLGFPELGFLKSAWSLKLLLKIQSAKQQSELSF